MTKRERAQRIFGRRGILHLHYLFSCWSLFQKPPNVMPTPQAPAEEHQQQWREIVADPTLRDLPYKVETNHRGQIVLSPHTTHHAR